ncbi:hypothetical protein AB0H77_15445 [Streptomyces sp. NPDC050844]|uniref:hypothetical protein n=1 Tax=Streptomyces sp. NPDC050844 TaxID=3155790 RepID=UPI0033F9227D
MSAPLVVNTTDGTVWTRRSVTRGGLALYAMAGVCDCPDLVMATLPELAEHGIAGSADVLPMPVGFVSQEPRPIAYASKRTEAQLLLADRAERQRAAEWPWDMWCRRCLVNVTSHRTEADALEAADRHVKLSHAPQAEVHRLMAAGGLAELVRLRARVAELEAERTHLLGGGEPPVEGDLVELPSGDKRTVTRAWVSGRGDLRVDLDDGCSYFAARVTVVCRAEPAGPSVSESADKLTALFAPTQALRLESGGAE